MAAFLGRRRAENWKSLFSGVWQAEYRREVTRDNELSQTVPRGTLAFRGTVEISKGEAVRTSLVPSRNKERFYYHRCNNNNNYHLMNTCVGLFARRLYPPSAVFMIIRRHFLSYYEDEAYKVRKVK